MKEDRPDMGESLGNTEDAFIPPQQQFFFFFFDIERSLVFSLGEESPRHGFDEENIGKETCTYFRTTEKGASREKKIFTSCNSPPSPLPKTPKPQPPTDPTSHFSDSHLPG